MMSTTLAPPTPIVACHVHGHPAPQGSKRHIGKGVMVESSKHVKPWREAVKAAVLDARRSAVPVDTPVVVWCRFLLERPKSHYRTGRYAGELRAGAPIVPGYKPDLDKLVRATLDALKDAGVYRDDGLVVDLTASKRYASLGTGPVGLRLTVWHQADQVTP